MLLHLDGGRSSPNYYVDNDLMNGAPSQMYYDSMISQINNQIARVSEGGVASQQPFNPTPNNNTNNKNIDDDENEWC